MNSGERDKMLSGEWYLAKDPDLQARLTRTQRTLRELDATPNEDEEARRRIFNGFFGSFGAETQIRSPFYCDYGEQISIGKKGFVNYGAIMLDVNPNTIGDYAQIGPAVQIYTALHPVDAELRRSGKEAGKPVTVGNNVWIGGGSILCPGVTIGDNSVIGAGSVVVRDIPAGVVAVGNPCRVIKSIGN